MRLEGPSLQLALPSPRFEAASVETAAGSEGIGAFEDMLKNLALSANDRIHEAQAAGDAFAAGTRDDIHGTMLALSKADIELRVLGNVRNRVVDAFYEIWRMQI